MHEQPVSTSITTNSTQHYPSKQQLINQSSPKKVAFAPVSSFNPIASKLEAIKFAETEKSRTKNMIERANLSRKLGRYVTEIGQV